MVPAVVSISICLRSRGMFFVDVNWSSYEILMHTVLTSTNCETKQLQSTASTAACCWNLTSCFCSFSASTFSIILNSREQGSLHVSCPDVQGDSGLWSVILAKVSVIQTRKMKPQDLLATMGRVHLVIWHGKGQAGISPGVKRCQHHRQ